MILSDYIPGNSVIHRLSPGIKILLLILMGTLLFIVPHLSVILPALIVVMLLYPLAHLHPRILLQQLKPLLWILGILFAVQWWVAGWLSGVLVVARLITLLSLAALVTLTTRTSDMTDTLEKGLFWLRFLHINPAKVSLALSLTLRFIPVLATITAEVREAQKARGLDRSMLAVAIPVVVRTLKMADDIAAALEARAYDPRLSSTGNKPERTVMSNRDLVYTALFAAITAALGLFPPFTLPVIAVPITAQTLGCMLAGAIAGARCGALALLLFDVLIFVGLPLLPGGRGGIGIYLGPGGGFLFAWPLAALCIGFLYQKNRHSLTLLKEILFLSLGGIVVIYACGIPWASMMAGVTLQQAALGALGFIPGDVIKVVLAALVVRAVRRAWPTIR